MNFLQMILVFLSVLFAPAQTPVVERPIVNVPVADRQENWGSGSCVHATMVSLFRWQGQNKMANYWRTHYSGGEWVKDMAAKLDNAGVRYAYVNNGDVQFLEWATSTRRGCGITVHGGRHMVALVHLDNDWAAILDNNSTSKFIWIPSAQLIAEWKNSGGWAITPVYIPAAPLPGVNT